MTTNAIPPGYHSLTPYLIVKDAHLAVEFYARAFGAAEVMRLNDPKGRIAHAELKIGDTAVFLADEFPEWNARGPRSIGATPVSLHLYVEDVDAVVSRAVAAGASILMPVKDEFYGDRVGRLEDPFGHIWLVATHIEDVSAEEMQRRFDEWSGRQAV